MAMSDESTLDGWSLTEIRADEWRGWIVTVVALVVGLGLAWIHWSGLIVGGALVSLPSDSAGRGILAGIGFGILAWVVFLVTLAVSGTLGTAITMGDPFYLSLGIAVGLGGLGGLVRGVV